MGGFNFGRTTGIEWLWIISIVIGWSDFVKMGIEGENERSTELIFLVVALDHGFIL